MDVYASGFLRCDWDSMRFVLHERDIHHLQRSGCKQACRTASSDRHLMQSSDLWDSCAVSSGGSGADDGHFIRSHFARPPSSRDVCTDTHEQSHVARPSSSEEFCTVFHKPSHAAGPSSSGDVCTDTHIQSHSAGPPSSRDACTDAHEQSHVARPSRSRDVCADAHKQGHTARPSSSGEACTGTAQAHRTSCCAPNCHFCSKKAPFWQKTVIFSGSETNSALTECFARHISHVVLDGLKANIGSVDLTQYVSSWQEWTAALGNSRQGKDTRS